MTTNEAHSKNVNRLKRLLEFEQHIGGQMALLGTEKKFPITGIDQENMHVCAGEYGNMHVDYCLVDKDELPTRSYHNIHYMYVVYDHPSDYPDSYVIRKWAVNGNVEPWPVNQEWVTDDLEGMREQLKKMGWIYWPRDPQDDPVILECYI